uniref:N-terminal kinase-like protein n=1 Tax=Panstrongylus megistus TaxID=65343 RepID=A0A069DWW8_9HEMI
MWNFFSRESPKLFSYDIIETFPLIPGSYCNLCKGISKAEKEVVSIFSFDKKTGNSEEYELTKRFLRRLKTLRHPGIVTFLDSFENEDHLYIVTEYVEPLLPYLEKSKDTEVNALYIPWGIMNIVRAVSFLNEDGKLRHNNLSATAVFVTEAGVWKLADLGYVTELNALYPTKDSYTHKYDPPEIVKSRSGPISSPWAIDSWGLGILVWEVYNGKIVEAQNLKKINNVPSNLKPIYCEMVAAKAEKRPSTISILKRCSQHGEYFSNVLIKTLSFLEEIHLKAKEDVNIFFKDLMPLLEKIPKNVAQHLVLQQIIRAYEFGNEGSYLVPPFLKISESMEETQYQKTVVPFIVKLFMSNDRATRSNLLQNLEQYIDKLPTSVINDTLFPLLVNGFIDANPRIREQTVKAMVDVVPKLSRKNIDDEVLRHLARLQSKDEHGGIRTNTTVCLGKIAHCLHPSNRSAVLMSAFLRSLLDPFPPVRNAGILALAVCQQYFSLQDVGKKILPALCVLTLDPELSVRENTFRTIKGYLGKLEKVSENPSLKEEMEKEALSSKAYVVGTWAEWAVTAIASKFSAKMGDTKATNQDMASKESATGSLSSRDIHNQLPDVEKTPFASEERIVYSESIIYDDKTNFEEPSSLEEESGWDDGTWLSLSDNEETNSSNTDDNRKPKTSFRSTEDNHKRPCSGPMKLGTKIPR